MKSSASKPGLRKLLMLPFVFFLIEKKKKQGKNSVIPTVFLLIQTGLNTQMLQYKLSIFVYFFQLSAMDKNPFAWDNSSSDLNSKTVGLSLTDGNGKPLDLAGQELEMFVPRNLKINPVKPMELNHFEDGDPPMRVHKFNRSSLDAGIAVEIKTFHPRIRFMVAVRYDKKPTANHYDYAHTFPTLEESKKMKKRPHPFTYVIPHTLINTLLFGNKNESDNDTKADASQNITIKQFYLGVKAVNKDSLGDVNTSYALRLYLPACKMFDEETNTWTSKGCRVGLNYLV